MAKSKRQNLINRIDQAERSADTLLIFYKNCIPAHIKIDAWLKIREVITD